MKKRILVLSLTLLIMTAILLSSCGGGSPTTQNTTSTATSTSTNLPATSSTVASTSSSTTAKTTTTAATTANSSLADLLAKMSSVSTVKYDAVVVPPTGDAMTQKFWLKKNKMRIETDAEVMNSISFIDTQAKTMINYIPSQNLAMKMDFSQAPQSGADAAQTLQNSSPTVVGVETIDGYVCTVLQYTDQQSTTKMWIGQTNGLPIKVETMTPVGKVVVNLKNISFENIDDNLFELPAGVTVMDMNIPGGRPGGIPTNIPGGLPTNIP
jgi:hypothetical protein